MCGNYPTPFPRPTTPFSATPSLSKHPFCRNGAISRKRLSLPMTCRKALPGQIAELTPSAVLLLPPLLRSRSRPLPAAAAIPSRPARTISRPLPAPFRSALRIDAVPTQKGGNSAAAAAKIVNAYLTSDRAPPPDPKTAPRRKKTAHPFLRGGGLAFFSSLASPTAYFSYAFPMPYTACSCITLCFAVYIPPRQKKRLSREVNAKVQQNTI